uniref:MATH domain-containing protein n=1 Tax=Panagrellus redivivus TaxID=6233 RepID=A0A7E4UZR1_PANRE
MERSYDDVITITLPSHLLDPIYNKLLTKSSINSLQNGGNWFIQCYPAGNTENQKNALVLILQFHGVPTSIATRVVVNGNDFFHSQNSITNDKRHPFVHVLEHDALKALNLPSNIEIKVHGTFSWDNMNASPGILPTPPKISPSLSGHIILTETDIKDKKMGDCLSSCKYDVQNVPGFQWWLECYPNGNSGKQSKTCMIFFRVSKAPITVLLKYYIENATKTVLKGTKLLSFTNVDALRDVLQINHDNPSFKDGFVNGFMSFVCIPTFGVGADELVPLPPVIPPFAAPSAASLTNSDFEHQSQSASTESDIKPQASNTDSTSFVFNLKNLLNSTNGTKPITTEKRRIANITNLEWWLEIYLAGNTTASHKSFIAFVRVSTAPVSSSATFSFAETNITKTINFQFARASARGANFTVSHSALTTAIPFTNEHATLNCTVQFSPATKSGLVENPKAKQVAEPAQLAKPSIKQMPSTTHILKFYVSRKHFTDPRYIIRTSRRKIYNKVEWFITCTPGDHNNDKNKCVSIYLNATSKVSGTAKYEVEGTRFQGNMRINDTASVLIKQICHTELEAYLHIKQFDVKIVATLHPTTLPNGTSEPTDSDSSDSDCEELSATHGMTDKELLAYRLKLQTEETNKVLAILKKREAVMIDSDFL